MPRLTTEPSGNQRLYQSSSARAFFALLGIAGAVVAGSLLGLSMERPKAAFLIILAIAVWSVGGWLLAGWRSVVVGSAWLSAALAASNSNYLLLFAICGLLLLFLLKGGLHQER